MKRLCIWVLVLLSGLLTLQAQESELRPPRIFGLACRGNQLSSIDVSGCPSLSGLYCNRNNLTTLDVSGCPSLEYLDCNSNQLSSLDVSGCRALVTLNCDGNQLSSLDVSGCIALKELAGVTADTLKIHGMSMDTLALSVDGSYCHINVLDAKGCPSLTSLDCERNGLTALDVSGCPSLEYLNCSYNQLSNLDMSGLTSLESLYCSDNQLSSLDVSGCTSLESLYCYRNQLSNLDVNGLTSLERLDCYNNQLSSLDVSGLTSLERLYCNNNQLSSLDVSGLTSLERLYCNNNQLSNLDVSGCTSLESLYCHNNQLSNLDVSGCTALTDLHCAPANGGGGTLRSLVVGDLTSLESLDCSNNQLSTLDVSGCTSLESLYCHNNQLSNLDAGGCTSLRILNCSYNHLPLSMLYKIYSQSSHWSEFRTNQSDSIMLLIDQPLDLSPERIIGQTLSTFTLTDKYGGEVSSDFYTENKFVFRFHEPLRYALQLKNKAIGSASFTWYISVVEEMPVQYFNVQVVSNNTEWGTATMTGSGTYEEGTEATITASPKEGCRFINWTKKDGSVFSTEAVHTFAVTENLELTANFEQGVGNESRGNDGFFIYVQDHTIYLSAERGLVQVYSATGVCVYSGHATAIPVKSSGLYIVRAGEHAYKAMVR